MTNIKAYLIKHDCNEITVSPEELRLLILNDILKKTSNIFEISGNNRISLQQTIHHKLNSSGGLILWYRSQQDATNAYTEILQLAASNLPPVSCEIELAYLSGLEMSYCLAMRSLSIFENIIEDWLKQLSYKNVEEEIEQGIMVFDYYTEHAEIIQSASFTSNSAPRKIEKLKIQLS